MQYKYILLKYRIILKVKVIWERPLWLSGDEFTCNAGDTCSIAGSGITSVQLSSVTQSCRTLCNPMECSMPGFPVRHQLPELTQLMSIELVMPSNHLILCCPLFLLLSLFPSIKVFSSESVLHIRWPKYWSF